MPTPDPRRRPGTSREPLDRHHGRAGLPRGVRPGRRGAGAAVRGHRAGRGRRSGGVRRGGVPLAAVRTAPQPGGVADDDREEPRHRPAPPGVHPRRATRAGRRHARTLRRRTRRPRHRELRPRRPSPAHLHLLPPGARPRRPGGAHPPAARRTDDGRDRPRLLRRRGGDEQAADPVEAEDQGRAHPLPRPARPRAAIPAGRRPRHAVPRLQRGLPALVARRRGPHRPVRRGDPAGPGPRDPHARRAGGAGPARPHAPDRGASTCSLRRRSAGDLAGAGPHAVGRPAGRRGARPRPGLPAPRAPGSVPDPGGHQRGPHRRRPRAGHRLGTDRRALRPAVRGDANPRRGAQPRRCAGRVQRAGGRAGGAGVRRRVSTATTRTRRPGPTCCGGPTGSRRRSRHTGPPSS